MARRANSRTARKRLLLIETFRGALRRNERSMLFPFLQGLAAARGIQTRWLCFGGDVGHLDGAGTRRSLVADFPPDDLRALASRLDAFRPTHVISNDLLSPPAQALLASRAAPPVHLVMPMSGETPGGRDATTRGGAFARCGWFLDWLGEQDARAAGRYLVEEAAPDYSAVMANPAARQSTSQITLVSGALCLNSRTVAGNPHFAALDLTGDEHRGCSFCKSATMPAFTSPRADLLRLLEKQFRAIAKTAGKAGRDKGRYEFFDIRAFWRFDEVFKLVLRLKVPPAVFLFNPRMDDVLRQRRKIERMLPALAKAGHEVRILSMGAENFSERENERFNKGISLRQVDEFLALTKRWEKEYGRVFKPFKAGHEAVELGFILFTPWTRLEDLRLNLERAAERCFPARGYWLYSTLFIEPPWRDEPPTPIYRLAKHEGLLCGSFPDNGQLYGLFKNEGETPEVAPWAFKEKRVADFFALLVRVCAVDREGADCAFFRDDPEFAKALELYGAAKDRSETTPLQFAQALLAVMRDPAAPASRAELLEAAVMRAEEVARLAAPAQAAPGKTEPAKSLSPRAQAVAGVVARLAAARSPLFAGVAFKPVSEPATRGARRIRLSLTESGRELVVDLLDAAADAPCFLRSKHFRAVYHDDAPPPSERQREQLTALLRLADAAL